MPRIALSYRRADSAAISGRIFDRLSAHYGPGSVFMDIDEIPFGIDFRDHVVDVLSRCDAVVAVIGPAWTGGLAMPDRIREAADPVRLEIETALARGVPLIPVLVDGAVMPNPAHLPATLEPLAFRNACEIASGRDFHAHVDRLVRALDRVLAPVATTASVAFAAPAPAASSPGTPRPAPAPAWPAWRIALLLGLLALPQAIQFSGATPLFVAALVVSVIGTAILADVPERRLAHRVAAVAGLMTLATVVQATLGVLRASMTAW